jgi:L-lactate dehydrogenase complex protein LldG
MNARDAFLERVRQSVQAGNRAGMAPELPERGSVGYQGAGPDPVARFCEEFTRAGGAAHVAANAEAAWQTVRGLVRARNAQRLILSRGGLVDRLNLPVRLRQDGLQVATLEQTQDSATREAFFAADLGISNVEHLVAETGSLVMAARPDEPRSVSLLPPIHLALADKSQILPDLFDLFDLFSPVNSPDSQPPSCLTVITGPSKTGDIELRLVTGVHGPGEIHVILCTW